jgi:hypothetical protein
MTYYVSPSSDTHRVYLDKKPYMDLWVATFKDRMDAHDFVETKTYQDELDKQRSED